MKITASREKRISLGMGERQKYEETASRKNTGYK